MSKDSIKRKADVTTEQLKAEFQEASNDKKIKRGAVGLLESAKQSSGRAQAAMQDLSK